ncbi:MAG: hypothetical protein QHJ82_00880 [Verrucomicrobiota bacterium]|nr:hypothetical protein [Verrucomicrobiota bacterium]
MATRFAEIHAQSRIGYRKRIRAEIDAALHDKLLISELLSAAYGGLARPPQIG